MYSFFTLLFQPTPLHPHFRPLSYIKMQHSNAAHIPLPPPPADIVTDTRVYNLTAKASTGCTLLNSTMLSNVLFTVPNFITNNESTSYVYVTVESANVPVSFYCIHAYNDTIILTGTPYTITRGNYNARTMTALLNTLLPNITTTFDTATNKFTFYSATYFSLGTASIAPVLGLNSALQGAVVVSGKTGYYLYAPNVANFLPPQRICFRSSLLHTGCVNSYDLSCDTFLSLPTSAANGGIVYYGGSAARFLIDREYLGQLDIRVTDELNRELDFAGIPWTISIRVESSVRRAAAVETFRSIIAENAARLSAWMEAQGDAFAVSQQPLWYDSPTAGATMLHEPKK